MKKAFFGRIAITIALIVGMFALVACGSNGGNTSDTKNTDQKTEKKISLSEAVENYDAKTVKRIDATAEGTLSFFMMNTTSQSAKEAQKKDIGVKLGFTRITNEDENYAKAELLPNGKADDSVIGVFNAVKESGSLGKTGEYIDFVIDFLKDKVTAQAELGVKDDAYNLKAEYRDNGTKVVSDSFWGVFNMESVSNLSQLDFKTEVLAKTLLSDSIIGKFNMEGTDKAAKRVTKDGIANYDIELEIDDYINDLAKNFVGMLSKYGVKLENEKATAVQQAVNVVKRWITVEPTSLKAVVGKDKLPKSMRVVTTITIDVQLDEFREMNLNLAAAGLMEEDQAKAINTAAWGLTVAGTRSSKNEKDYIGLSLTLDLEERFAYEQSSCNTENTDRDLYISDKEEAEGRVNLVDLIVKVGEEEGKKIVEEFVKKYEADEDTMKAVVAEILASFDFSSKISVADILEVSEEICVKYELKEKTDETETKADETADENGEKEEETAEKDAGNE